MSRKASSSARQPASSPPLTSDAALKEIVYRETDSLKPYVRNARTHSESQIDMLAASILQLGFLDPIEIDPEGMILAGHCRQLAALKLGITSVPCVVHLGLSNAQKRAYCIANNRLAEIAGWSSEMLSLELNELRDLEFPMDVLGYTDQELETLYNFTNIEELDAAGDSDNIPSTPAIAISKHGDVWLCGKHRILCGDSTVITDVEKLVDGSQIDLLITDPPYGVSYADKNSFLNALDEGNRNQEPIDSDHMSETETSAMWLAAFSNAFMVMKPGASYYVTGPQVGELFLLFLLAIKDSGLILKHMLIWVKNNHVLGRSDYNYKHEPILYGWKDGGHKFYGEPNETSVWEIPKPQKSDLHPTMKPVELFERAIKNSSKTNANVLDLFTGSGTSLIACENQKRRAFCLEKAPLYVDVIVTRWMEWTGKEAVHAETGVSFTESAKSANLAVKLTGKKR